MWDINKQTKEAPHRGANTNKIKYFTLSIISFSTTNPSTSYWAPPKSLTIQIESRFYVFLLYSGKQHNMYVGVNLALAIFTCKEARLIDWIAMVQSDSKNSDADLIFYSNFRFNILTELSGFIHIVFKKICQYGLAKFFLYFKAKYHLTGKQSLCASHFILIIISHYYLATTVSCNVLKVIYCNQIKWVKH